MYRTKFLTLFMIFGFGFSVSVCQQEENQYRGQSSSQIIDLTEDEDQVQEQHQNVLGSPAEQLIQAVITNNVSEVSRLVSANNQIDLYPAFFQAIKQGHRALMQIFLAQPSIVVNMPRFFADGELVSYDAEIQLFTPLLMAIKYKRLNIAEDLIREGAHVTKGYVVDIPTYDNTVDPVYYAVLCNDCAMVEILLKSRDNWEKQWGKFSPLHAATRRGNIPMLDLLLRYAIRDSRGTQHETSVHIAADSGQLGVLKTILSYRPQLARATYQGISPLHKAARKGHLNIVRFLVEEYGVSPDLSATSRFGNMPLHVAAQSGHLEVVRYLVNAGASLDTRNTRGQAAQQFAQQKGHPRIVSFLERQGGMRAQRWQQDHVVREARVHSEQQSQGARRAVAEDAQEIHQEKDNRPVAGNKELEKDGAVGLAGLARDIQQRDQRASQPSVRKEFMQKIEAGRIVHVVEVLQRSRALAQIGDARGYMPLHHAARHAKWAIFRLLVSLGASTDDKDAAGYTTLHYAVLGGNKALVNFLMQKKLPMLAEATDGKTAFDLAVEHGHEEIVSLFLKALENADKLLLLNRPTQHGVLPLHEAARRGSHALGRVLIENGARVSCYDLRGSTPLHYAVGAGHVEMVRVLMDAGAVVQLQNRNHETALDSAKRIKNQAMIDLLERSAEEQPPAKRQKTGL